ncbi:glycosyltransferase [Sporanaerobium hydrogeniformans]|uniref:glycosyltransferase n=1 Tax=Sporanaerobium hydrogeniformans TaxID=3072179 RepID=UPI0015D50776|nr:glycosyltransferase [Sporanaerobium hydrogeniformans]
MQKGKKILLALMSFDIGGVETHVLELACGLKKAGHIPVVVSNGGRFEEDLSKEGIGHIKVPLHNKNPLNMWKAYRMLKSIIKEEKIDIIHAHARIPGFILGKIHKETGIPFVTSAHWVFNTAWIYRVTTDWGPQTIAVSEDIKKYLMDNYSIPESQIKVTINGISTERFSPEIPHEDVVKELGIDENKIKLVYISRLDEDRSLVVHHLLEVATELYEKHPNLQIIIVGGGNDFERVKAKVEAINSKLGVSFILLGGPRTDINKFTALADLFVGVSRAALEAMAAKCPTLVAGNEGYIGIFDESKWASAKASNFTCRGEKMCEPSLLKEDLEKLLALNEEERKRLGEYGYEIIEKYYSVKKMTEDNLAVYEKVLKD